MKTWNPQILAARTWHELVQVARDFVASLDPHEWARLPEGCRPARIKGVDDLEFWRRRCAEEYLGVASDPHGNDVLRRVLAFFTAASDRANEIYGTASAPEENAMNDGAPAPDREARSRRSE
jgi:hypothetical protein